jgi:Xaa-Pro aminopeptidase
VPPTHTTGRFSNEQREVYETVLCAQQAVLGSIRPGVAWEDMHRLAERVIAEGLLSMGIARGSLEDVLKHHVANVFFPHGSAAACTCLWSPLVTDEFSIVHTGLGHLLGLETHDPVGYPVVSGRTSLLYDALSADPPTTLVCTAYRASHASPSPAFATCASGATCSPAWCARWSPACTSSTSSLRARCATLS